MCKINILYVNGLVSLGNSYPTTMFFTACSVILAALDFTGGLIVFFGIVTAIIGIIAGLGLKVILPCSIVSIVVSFIWSILLYWLYRIAVAVGCLIQNPTGPKPPPSSSSSLTSRGGVHTNDQVSIKYMTNNKENLVGLGDIMKLITEVMGIQACEKCHKRAARLNKLIPFEKR